MDKKILNKIKDTPLKTIKLPVRNIMYVLKKNELKNWNYCGALWEK